MGFAALQAPSRLTSENTDGASGCGQFGTSVSMYNRDHATGDLSPKSSVNVDNIDPSAGRVERYVVTAGHPELEISPLVGIRTVRHCRIEPRATSGCLQGDHEVAPGAPWQSRAQTHGIDVVTTDSNAASAIEPDGQLLARRGLD
jgi:hypothetical protein